MNATNLIHFALIALVASSTGCQSWQGMSFPLQNNSRVPPPGTGTYQLPSGYYNNNSTSALPTDSTSLQANTATGLRSASGPLPTTNMATNNSAGSNFVTSAMLSQASGLNGNPSTANSFAPASEQSPVVSAAYTQNAAAQFTASSQGDVQQFGIEPNGTSARLSDSTSTEVPSLQWQQFGGQ